MRTPHAIAAVRGTLALFIVSEKTTEIRVLEGLLDVFSRLAPTVATVIRPNELVTVADKLGSVTQMTPGERQATVEGAQAPKPKEQSEKPPEQVAKKVGADKLQEAAQLAADMAKAGPAVAAATVPSSVAPTTTPGTSTSAIGVQATSATQVVQQIGTVTTGNGVSVASFSGDIIASKTFSLSFSSASDTKIFEVTTAVGTTSTWFVSTLDCCISGDKWKAGIFHQGKELVSVTGTGSTSSFSDRVGVTTTGSKTFEVKVGYTTGVDIFPAGMDTKFDTTKGDITITQKK